mmetsp:Transcript_29285/g.84748  ORF Transcript_29285/g.84748 Transcript_29285/m.84748 type:complete len:210 (+) Transcript_29285:1-630(+)
MQEEWSREGESVIVYQTVEHIRSVIPVQVLQQQEETSGQQEEQPAATHEPEEPQAPTQATTCREPPDDEQCEIDIVHGDPIIDRKSVFQAHLARVHDTRDVQAVQRALMRNQKIARATHNIMAYRIQTAQGHQLSDHDSDGESAAGGRLQHLLSIVNTSNIMVVVSRWYGGIHLGPDRFKHINNAARELMVKCGVIADEGPPGDKRRRK